VRTARLAVEHYKNQGAGAGAGRQIRLACPPPRAHHSDGVDSRPQRQRSLPVVKVRGGTRSKRFAPRNNCSRAAQGNDGCARSGTLGGLCCRPAAGVWRRFGGYESVLPGAIRRGGGCCAAQGRERKRPTGNVVAPVFGIAVAVAALGLLGAYIGRVALATPVRYVIAFRPILMGVYRLEMDSRSAAEPKHFVGGWAARSEPDCCFARHRDRQNSRACPSFAAYKQSFICGGLLLFLYGIGDGFPLMLVGTAAGRCAEADRLQPFPELNRPHSRRLARPARLLFALASLNGVSSPRRSPGRETPNPLGVSPPVIPRCACVPFENSDHFILLEPRATA